MPPGPDEITEEINRFARGHFKEAQEVVAYPICLRLAAAHRVIDDHVPFPALGLMDRGERVLQAADTIGIATDVPAGQVLQPVWLQTRTWQ